MIWLKVLDSFFTLLHVLIIGFNLLGWIWPSTRRLHLYAVLITAASWLLLGIWYGIGYCPITDWQWQVKTKLGENNLPDSFIKYQVDTFTGTSIDAGLVDSVTAISFAVVSVLSVYLNILDRKKQRG
ncbi:DUF2784 domain-containing protein [Parapedobacter sp. ISTM3]|uniref:DUF2784 domain-containing protein n=1 Tax=Parapedobacter luteus TaxID=623280 RepID=A0A1T5A4E8_9SPHI|nr:MULTISPECIES: DUF2784 domain-containing protein [Parapedobacter]MBK1440183.1 DUF2784 domain-containing protein [Parapedobacter sp. ISTM3]SKB29882.1 Protein of Unknown function [Parapedobacter luteus]